jgi:hypothetical protein
VMPPSMWAKPSLSNAGPKNGKKNGTKAGDAS